MSVRRGAVVGALIGGIVLVVVLAVVLSVWVLTVLPVLLAAVYATCLGMTPGRFLDALDGSGPGAGTGTTFPI
jgi:uncharacterized protein YqhQ